MVQIAEGPLILRYPQWYIVINPPVLKCFALSVMSHLTTQILIWTLISLSNPASYFMTHSNRPSWNCFTIVYMKELLSFVLLGPGINPTTRRLISRVSHPRRWIMVCQCKWLRVDRVPQFKHLHTVNGEKHRQIGLRWKQTVPFQLTEQRTQPEINIITCCFCVETISTHCFYPEYI